ERERPEYRSIGLLTGTQVAHAPRTVTLTVPYTHLQSTIDQYLPDASHLVNNVNFQLTAATFEKQSGRQDWIGARIIIKDREERPSK
ncbi:MAG TPA: hypothetical protein VFV58_17890, partial [Blastocatellia bacterium]|nr:hypothetical protein [Blastocatellia bacterium]